jgi:hypothetical protein
MNKQEVHDLYVSNIGLLNQLLPLEKLEDIQEDIEDAEYQLSRLDEFWEKADDVSKKDLFKCLNNLNGVYTTYTKMYE